MIVAYVTGFLAGFLAAGLVDRWCRRHLRARVCSLEDRCRDVLAEADRAREGLVEAREDRRKAWELLASELRRELV